MNYRSNLKEVKEFTFVKDFIYNFTLALFITLLLCVLAVKIFNVRLDVVESDSMYPEFRTGDIVVVVPQDSYKINDVVEYKKGNSYVSHRIVAYDETTGVYKLRGDNTSVEFDGSENITNKDITGKVMAIWENGEQVYETISKNYLLIMAIIIGCWVLTSTISGEIEMKKHNILNI